MKRILFVLLIFPAVLHAQTAEPEFVSPMPDSRANSRESTIIIRHGALLAHSAADVSQLEVVGSESGRISGRLVLSSDQKTLVFYPDHPLAAGERVTVTLSGEIMTQTGDNLPGVYFSFDVVDADRPLNPYALLPELRPTPRSERHPNKTSTEDLPERFPGIETVVYDSAAVGEGYIYMAVASEAEDVGYYLMMLNNDGTPFFAEELEDDYAYDFKRQPDGRLSYAHFFEHHSYTGGGNVVHKIMDETLTVSDSVQMGNGYVAEAHDFQILPNGHYLLFGYYLTPVDMSLLVDGGQPDALVSGGVVQELDMDKNVIFQWRTWDHYDIETYSFNERRAGGPIVSAFHLNTINLDDDGHIFLATPRHVMKISRSTGEVIWNLGGNYNEFTFDNLSQEEGSSRVAGHHFHRLPSGNVLVYDNGSRRSGSTSRVHEFSLDEEALTAALVWSYEPESPIAAWHRGNAQRLPNGNTVIGWGGASGDPVPAMTEVDASGSKVFELTFTNPDVESYRAFRFPFEGGAPAAEVVLPEVAPGSRYFFASGDTVETGISFNLTDLSGGGYNELIARTYNHAPLKPQFGGKAPRVLPRRVVLDQFALSGIEGSIEFDVDLWNIDDPNSTTIYFREFEDQGYFLPLPSAYNAATNRLVAQTTTFGEYILAIPDIQDVRAAPILIAPSDSGTVNRELPVSLSWTPRGFATSYDLQIATDTAFASPVVDQEQLTETKFEMDEPAESTTYHWRVRSTNEAGIGPWSDPWSFTTVAPFLTVDRPTDGDVWQRGLEYHIRWSDNIREQVHIELLRDNVALDTLATTESDGAFRWEVDLAHAAGPGYVVRISSSTDDALDPALSAPFSVIDTTAVAIEDDGPGNLSFELGAFYPNPVHDVARLPIELPEAGRAELTCVDLTGRFVARPMAGLQAAGRKQIAVETSHWPAGMYICRLQTTDGVAARTLVVAH